MERRQKQNTDAGLRWGGVGVVVLAGVVIALSPNSTFSEPGPKLLFASGFEADTTIGPVSERAHNQWPAILGADRSTGFSWEAPLFNNTGGGYTLLQTLTLDNSKPPPGSPTDYIRNSIETVIGPSGDTTRALKMHIVKPSPNTCCTQEAVVVTGLPPIMDVYIAYWIKLNPEHLSQLQAEGDLYWRMLWEMKTVSDYRIQAGLDQADGIPHWYAQADNGGLTPPSSLVVYWKVKNYSVRAPLDDWFYSEVYLHRSPEADGRFFWAVNRQPIVDRRGPNYGVKMDRIAALMLSMLYGVNPANWYQWLDDLEVWDGPPCRVLPCGPPDARMSRTLPSDRRLPRRR